MRFRLACESCCTPRNERLSVNSLPVVLLDPLAYSHSLTNDTILHICASTRGNGMSQSPEFHVTLSQESFSWRWLNAMNGESFGGWPAQSGRFVLADLSLHYYTKPDRRMSITSEPLLNEPLGNIYSFTVRFSN